MDRDELHDLVMSFKEKFEAGKFEVQDPHLIEEMSRVRLAADGKIDPVTVGSMVRATALASIAADASRP